MVDSTQPRSVGLLPLLGQEHHHQLRPRLAGNPLLRPRVPNVPRDVARRHAECGPQPRLPRARASLRALGRGARGCSKAMHQGRAQGQPPVLVRVRRPLSRDVRSLLHAQDAGHEDRPVAMGHLRVLADPAGVTAAFEAACDWCEAMVLATPAAASSSRRWSAWGAIERNAAKIAAAYVAIDGLRTEPAVLDWFQSQDCLRFVPAADGSFRVNLFRFQKGEDVRVLMGAGQLAPPGLMAPLDAMLLWEGGALDPFAASIEAVFEKARAKGHVP